jgi:hypothetical protein
VFSDAGILGDLPPEALAGRLARLLDERKQALERLSADALEGCPPNHD